MQWQKNKGALFNKTSLGKITNIQITTTSSNEFTKIIGDTLKPTENKEGGYFNISVGNTTGKTDKVVITFEK